MSHGVLTIGGAISMILGSLILFDAPEVALRISWWVILPTVATTTGIFALAPVPDGAGGRAARAPGPGRR